VLRPFLASLARNTTHAVSPLLSTYLRNNGLGYMRRGVLELCGPVEDLVLRSSFIDGVVMRLRHVVESLHGC
jgi:hypothetical protein